MIRKLKKKNGETLIEALVSILIATLAMGLVSTATIAAANLNEKNRQADEMFAEELMQAENYLTEKESKQMLILFEDGSHQTVNVDVYGKDGRFASYKQEGELP